MARLTVHSYAARINHITLFVEPKTWLISNVH